MIRKLGPHVIRPTGDALDWARHANVVKALDDATALRQAPGARYRIYRRYFPTQDINRGGVAVVAEALLALGDAPATHLELFNETAQRLGQGLERYVAFTREAVPFLKAVRPDLTLVAFCFSTGNPEPDDWAYIRQHGYGGASVIGLHEYWGTQGFTGWNALRYRKVHEWTGGDHPPFLITECGRDKVEGGQGGYVADGVGEDRYVAELDAFDVELQTDAYVLGGTVFTAGPTPDWRNFTTDPLSGRLVALTRPLPPEEPPVPDWYPPAVRRPISVNYTAGRGGRLPTVLVDHVADGLGSPWAWFNTDRGDRGSSAHFWVSKAGKVEQYRPLGDTCWANGIVNKPDMTNAAVAAIVNEPVNPNRVSVAIEHEGHPGDVFPPEQIEASHQLHAWLGAQYRIAMTRERVLGHYQFDSVTRANCPGASHPWQAILGGSSVPDTEATLRDQAYALGTQLAALGPKFQTVGCPQTAEYVRNQGQAIERTMVIQKGEK